MDYIVIIIIIVYAIGLPDHKPIELIKRIKTIKGLHLHMWLEVNI